MKCKCGRKLIERRCESCGIIATHWNDRTGEVYQWSTIAEHEEACDTMRDMLDDAFDNQYFSDGGW